MKIRILSAVLSICLLFSIIPIQLLANEVPEVKHNLSEEGNEEILDPTSASATSQITVTEIIENSKFTARQGHGFAAERGNDFIDKIRGRNTNVVGDNNVKNGPDRVIRNLDGTKILIQDKYYSTAKGSIEACFDEAGKFRYLDGDKNPMQIEVPKEQYSEAVEMMRNKIKEGKIPGVTDPNEAENLVRPGKLSYTQAVRLAKAGTIESLTYDAVHGVVGSGYALGISAVLNYSMCRIYGVEREKAIKVAAEEGFKTGVMVFGASVVANQLVRTGAMNLFKPTSEAIVKAMGENFAKALLNSAGKGAVSAGEMSAAKATATAAKILRANALTSVVFTAVFTIPDAADLFRGRISKKQFVKNFAVTAISITAGTAGGIGGGALGNLLVPGVGTIPGAVVGSVVSGAAAGIVADKVLDYVTEDDAEEMYEITQNIFAQNCEDYMLNESETKNVADQFGQMLDEDMFKDMYQSDDRETYISEKMEPLFEAEIQKRAKIELPTEKEMREALKEELKDVVFVH